jgi:hypothetical protein
MTWRDKRTRVVIPVTGYTALLEIRDKPGGVLLHKLTSDVDGGLTLGGAAGTIRVQIPSATTKAWTWEDGLYELWLIHSTGAKIPLLEGPVTAQPAVADV